MNRRHFIKDSCLACLGIALSPMLLESCKSIRHISGNLMDNGISFPLSEFRMGSDTATKYRPYLIVRNDALQYPICVYRFDDHHYSALYMRCTHQGAELQAAGDRLTCPAHGSEFDNKGLVKQGPADQSLRNFPVSVMDEALFIDLRKQS